MDLTISTIIGDFILIAGSFLLLIFLVKNMLGEIFPASWMNVLKRFSSDIDGAEEARKKAEELANQREAELAGSRTEAKTIIENAKGTAEKSKADILAEAKLEAGA